METVTREEAASKLDALARGALSLADIRRWSGRIVAADDVDISDADAALVSRVINVIEDAGIADDELKTSAAQLAGILRLQVADDIQLALIALVINHDRFVKLLGGVISGKVSHVGFANALSNTDFSTMVRQRLKAMSNEEREKLLSGLAAGDHRAMAAALI